VGDTIATTATATEAPGVTTTTAVVAGATTTAMGAAGENAHAHQSATTQRTLVSAVNLENTALALTATHAATPTFSRQPPWERQSRPHSPTQSVACAAWKTTCGVWIAMQDAERRMQSQ
jgi:hypothetical protein